MEELSPKKPETDIQERNKKSRKRRPVHKEAEYDFEDPFIDDTEAANAYVSIFDLMAGRVGEQEFDTMEIPRIVKSEDDNCRWGSAKRAHGAEGERAKDFFVYQGPLVEQTEKEFEIPKKRRKLAVQPNQRNQALCQRKE